MCTLRVERKTYSSAGSFPQSTMENNTTFIYQQRREFIVFSFSFQAFPVPFSSYCKSSCLCYLCYAGLFLSAAQPASLGHSVFRKLLYASVLWISFLVPFLLSSFLLSPDSFLSLEVISLESLPGHSKLERQEADLMTLVFLLSTGLIPASPCYTCCVASW